MNIIGKTVNHKTFGSGTVTALTDKIITISFHGTEKRFIYPDAFKRFLVFKGRHAQEYAEELIREKEAAIQRKKQIEQKENERRQKLLNFKISANSHLVMDVPFEEIDNVFQTLSVSAGTYLSGGSKGLPRVLDRVKPNSICFITSCLNGEEEAERKLIGAFMVEEDFFGDEVSTGIIRGHPKYHIMMPEEHSMLFWTQLNQAVPSRWGGVPFKYCSTSAANRMLSEMVGAVIETEQAAAAQEVYQYFCTINRLRPLIEQKTKTVEGKEKAT